MKDREFWMIKKASPFLAKSGFSLCMKLTAYLLTLPYYIIICYTYLILQPNRTATIHWIHRGFQSRPGTNVFLRQSRPSQIIQLQLQRGRADRFVPR